MLNYMDDSFINSIEEEIIRHHQLYPLLPLKAEYWESAVNTALIKNGYNLDHYSMSGIGYKEIYSYLNNKINYEDMRELILNRTNSFIKKQRTWFKKSDNRITWINTIEDNKIIKNISEKIFFVYR